MLCLQRDPRGTAEREGRVEGGKRRRLVAIQLCRAVAPDRIARTECCVTLMPCCMPLRSW